MPDLQHVGFFHLAAIGQDHPYEPVDLLKKALLKSGQEALFPQSLVVLPEAFNITGGYYPPQECVTDVETETKLVALSREMGICFVVGLIRGTTHEGGRYSEAILIDGDCRKVLSKKTRCDGSPRYDPLKPSPEDVIFSHRGFIVGALICMDAAAGDRESLATQQTRHADILKLFAEHAGRKILCVPARFGSSVPVAVARDWNEKVSVIIANWGSTEFASVLHLENGQVCIAATSGVCQVHLAALPATGSPSGCRLPGPILGV